MKVRKRKERRGGSERREVTENERSGRPKDERTMRTALARVGEEEGSSQEDGGGEEGSKEGKGGMGTDSIRHTKRGQGGLETVMQSNILL